MMSRDIYEHGGCICLVIAAMTAGIAVVGASMAFIELAISARDMRIISLLLFYSIVMCGVYAWTQRRIAIIDKVEHTKDRMTN